MGVNQSTEGGSDTPDRGLQGGQGGTQPRVQVATDKKRVPVVEEEFVQRMAYKCGVTGEELEKKKETYLDRMAKDPTLGFEEFKALYRDLCSSHASDSFLQQYVDAVFRAFDANKDSELTFKEWRVGFYLLLLLPEERGTVSISEEDFLHAMEIIFRLYDEDEDSIVTKKEMEQIICLLEEPTIAARLSAGMPVGRMGGAVRELDMDKYDGSITLTEFLDYFKKFLEENKNNV